MRSNFSEFIKNKTDNELLIISKDYSFYSPEERLLAMEELEKRNSLTEDLHEAKNNLLDSAKMEFEDNLPIHKTSLMDLLPHKNYLFTPILIYMNVFIFLLMLLSGSNALTPEIDILVKWGGNVRFLTFDGEYWRLFSSIFLHTGLIHLAFNMYALLYVGSLLESSIGSNKFISGYLLSGLIASVTSSIINENVISVGASGAIFGLYGVLLSLLLLKGLRFNNLSNKNLISSIGLFIIYNIVYGFREAGIDNAAHIGGLISGLMIGLFYFFVIKLPKIESVS